MELHRFDRQIFMAHRHDDAVVGYRGHFEAVGKRVTVGEQGMIAPHLESLRQPFENSLPGVSHPGGLPVHGVVEDTERTAERFDNSL